MAGELKPRASSRLPTFKMAAVKEEHPRNAGEESDGSEEDDDYESTGYGMQDDGAEEENVRDEDNEGRRYRDSDQSADQAEDETMIEDDETQVITPPKKGKRAHSSIHKEVDTTIEQYKAMIRTLQVELRSAQQQIRVISKSSLEDKFMAGQVKQYVKQSLWKRCKFITCRETMEECMEEVAGHFGITGEKRDHWKSTYEHAVRDALNNRRNSTAQGLKKELTGKSFTLIGVVAP